jgi:hypothetical protein
VQDPAYGPVRVFDGPGHGHLLVNGVNQKFSLSASHYRPTSTYPFRVK